MSGALNKNSSKSDEINFISSYPKALIISQEPSQEHVLILI